MVDILLDDIMRCEKCNNHIFFESKLWSLLKSSPPKANKNEFCSSNSTEVPVNEPVDTKAMFWVCCIKEQVVLIYHLHKDNFIICWDVAAHGLGSVGFALLLLLWRDLTFYSGWADRRGEGEEARGNHHSPCIMYHIPQWERRHCEWEGKRGEYCKCKWAVFAGGNIWLKAQVLVNTTQRRYQPKQTKSETGHAEQGSCSGVISGSAGDKRSDYR